MRSHRYNFDRSSVMDASPSTSDTSYMSIDLDSSILHQVQKAIHRYDLSTCTDYFIDVWSTSCACMCTHCTHTVASNPGSPKVSLGSRLTYAGTNQHSYIILLSIDLQQLPNRSLRTTKKYPYLKAWNQLPSLSPYKVLNGANIQPIYDPYLNMYSYLSYM